MIIPAVAIVAFLAGIGIGFAFSGNSSDESQLQSQSIIQNNDNKPDKLVVAVVPQGDVKKFEAQEQRLEEYFSDKIGIPVEIFYPIDDTTTLASIKSGTTHVAFMSSRPALLANEQNDGNVLAFMADLRPFKTDGGQEILGTSYMSQYWTLKDRNDINSLADMQGKSTAFSGPLSTGGYLFPIAELVNRDMLPSGDDPKEFFDNILFSGGYHQSLIALLNGEVDVAAGDDWAVFTFLTPEEQSRVKIIDSFGPVPTHSAVYKADIVDPETITKFEKAMIDLKEEHPDLLDKALFGATEYVPVNHFEHLQTLIDALDVTKIPHM
ncbi:phosphate/phosphite/phosphonate ABC transporter substrate-binding protein [Nitrosopumilus sp.]|uniref:phosphate/phosphite/phosphonate ABC transporter substrate-binding protein n=1 Tax=Nitrosopumilus sp. TaxID=2024843 RepID=UPI002931DDE7|nr:phosphate/phosphite/phosphonate ABC transporter substrate-binding protein [Nitrosopumilus sp.]